MNIKVLRDHKITGTEIETCIEEVKNGKETKYLISFLIEEKETKKLALYFNDIYDLYNSFKLFGLQHIKKIDELNKEKNEEEFNKFIIEKFQIWFSSYDEISQKKRNEFFTNLLKNGYFIPDQMDKWINPEREFEFSSLDDFTLTEYAEEFFLTILFDIFVYWSEKSKKKTKQ